MNQTDKPHVVIIGGGFGGLRAARDLARSDIQITLIDRCNHHLFQPLLYQVATANISAEEIAVPIRSVLRRQRNAKVLLGEAERVDLLARRVYLADGASLSYDFLIVAAGAQTNYYGHGEWQRYTVGLKDLEDAFEVRRRVLLAFEAAEREEDEAARQRLLSFVVIGGGPTGVEMAGALSELSSIVLAHDFRSIHGQKIRITLVEMGNRLLTPFHESLSARAREDLEKLGVEVRTNAQVIDITEDGVRLQNETIPAAMICWAAGVEPRPLSRHLGVTANARGFIDVNQECAIPGHPEVFVIGDMAAFVPAGGTRPLPGVAPVAMQQAGSVAANIRRTLAGKPRRPFVYFDKGAMATIGTFRAVLQLNNLRMAGPLAWFAWIFVHIFYLIGFRNRALVLFEWFWSYLSQRRGARLITHSQTALAGLTTSRSGGPRLKNQTIQAASEQSFPATTAWRVSKSQGAPYH